MNLNPLTIEFIRFWLSQKNSQFKMPLKKYFNLMKIPQVLPYIMTLHPHMDGDKPVAKILFSGSDICKRYRGDITGHDLLDLFSDKERPYVYKLFLAMVEKPVGQWRKVLTPYIRGVSTVDEVTVLPIFDQVNDRYLLSMLSYGVPSSDYAALDPDTGTIQLKKEEMWIDLGEGVPSHGDTLPSDLIRQSF